MKQIVNIDGQFFPPEEARISVFDHGFLYGDNVYETMRTIRRKVFVVDRHMKRLQNSASMLRLKLPQPPEQLMKEIQRTIEATSNDECYIRLIVTRGVGSISLDMDRSERSSFVMIVKPFELLPAEFYEKGIKVALVNVRRNSRLSVNPGIKSGNLLNNVLAYMEAKEQQAFEGILCNLTGHVTEGTASNLFLAKNGVLITPPLDAGLLPGVTRGLVLELAAQEKITVAEKDVLPEELLACDECFITGTTKGVVPIRLVNETAIPHSPGPITRAIMDAYAKFMEAV